MEERHFELVKFESENRENNEPHQYKECYMVETGSADTKELKDLIKEILLSHINHLDL